MSVILMEMDGYVQAASLSSVSIGTGTKRLTLTTDEPFIEDMEVTANDGTENNVLTGTVTSYNPTTKNLVLNVTATAGSGSVSNWIIGGVRTFKYSDVGYKTETGVMYPGYIIDPGNFEQYLFSPGSSFGVSSFGKGDAILLNSAGEIDYLRKVGINKRNFVLKRLDSVSSPYSSAESIFKGTMEQLTYTWKNVSVRMRDRLADLDKPAQEATFSGTNIGPVGIEGLEGDIKGFTKPFIYGYQENITLVLLNQSTQIYGCNFDRSGNTKAVQLFNNVYDNGVLLTFYANYSDRAGLTAAVIPAGYYATCVAEGLIRLNSTPVGTVTADITEGATAALRTAGQIVKRMLEERGGYTSADYDTSAFTALDVVNSMVVGIYVDNDISLLESIMNILNSVRGSIYVDQNNKFTVDVLKDPNDDASVETFSNKIKVIDRIASRDPGNGLPAKQTKVWYRKNYTIQSASEIAGSVTDARRQFVSNEYRSVVSAENLAVKTKHPNAPVMDFYTLLTNESNAITENISRNSIYTVERDWFRIRVLLTQTSSIKNINDVVTIQLERFGLELGKKFRIMGRILYFANPYVDYVVWG